MLTALGFVAGLVLGSFYNVCIYRIPRRKSIVAPPSYCPGCGHPLGPAELVPLFSFLLQRGRCRHCGGAIPWRYPLVELVTGIAFAAIVLRYGVGWRSALYLVLASLLVVIAGIDLDRRIIPNRLVALGLAAGAILVWAGRPLEPWSAVLGMAAAGAFMLVVVLLSRGGMGAGDMKLSMMIGLYLGWPVTAVALVISFVIGAVAGIVLMALGVKGRKDFIPFGPFLAAGGMLAALWGQEIVEWYVRSFM